MHLCGQASIIKELEEFSNDLALVIGAIVRATQTDTMVKFCLFFKLKICFYV